MKHRNRTARISKIYNLILLNQFGHGGTNVPPPISKYFSEIISQSYLKITCNNPNKDLKSTVGSREIQIRSKNIFRLKNKKQLVRGIRTHDLSFSPMSTLVKIFKIIFEKVTQNQEG